MRSVDLNGIAGVIAIHAERRDQHGAVDADRVHRGRHLVAGNLRWPVERGGPGAARVVAFVGVNLGIDQVDPTAYFLAWFKRRPRANSCSSS